MSQAPNQRRTAPLALAALGVVYGDIGTSPLYTIQTIFSGSRAVAISPDNILGILSMIVWSLIIVVSIKYVAFIMRADNRGEGGIMALMVLVLRGVGDKPHASGLMLLGLFGAALFYGDSVITPAISVLSAVEGLGIATDAFKPYILPITLLVLLVLFLCQRKGTSVVGALFGPVMVLWFSTLALLGIVNILHAPQVLGALNPLHAFHFVASSPAIAFFSLAAVVLAVTGTEALYADMGHFGRKPVQLAWFTLVLPALTLNYFGQGALLLHDKAAIQNPFYLLAPSWALYPLVALATAATVIASQAVISGAYSISQQAMQLGYSPRLEVQHTSSKERGQIYLPGINWILFIAVVSLVLGFGSSTSLAAAYGIAVTGTMAITTVLAYFVVRHVWGWKALPAKIMLGLFLLIDLAFFLANLSKLHEGGWFPLVFALGLYLLMTTWKRGRQLLRSRITAESTPLEPLLNNLMQGGVTRIPGTAVFMTQDVDAAPHALLHSLKHYKAIHERVVVLSVMPADVPHVEPGQQVEVTTVNPAFFKVRVYYGFMDKPDIPDALEKCASHGLQTSMMETSFFLGRETLIPHVGSEMALWREKLFIAMFRNAGSAASYFKLPPNRVVELGTQIVL